KVAGPEPAIPLDLDVGEGPLDDLVGHDAVGEALIRQDRAGVHVPAVDVEQGQLRAEGLEVLGGQLAVDVGRGDAFDLGGGEDGAADDADVSHEHAQRGQGSGLTRTDLGRR